MWKFDKSRYKGKLKAQYGANVDISQDENIVEIYFDTKRIPGSMTFGKTNYFGEESFHEATELYEQLLDQLGRDNLEEYSSLEEGSTPSGVAAWYGYIILGDSFYSNMEESKRDIIERLINEGLTDDQIVNRVLNSEK